MPQLPMVESHPTSYGTPLLPTPTLRSTVEVETPIPRRLRIITLFPKEPIPSTRSAETFWELASETKSTIDPSSHQSYHLHTEGHCPFLPIHPLSLFLPQCHLMPFSDCCCNQLSSMEKDYFRSKKYTSDQIQNLDIAYKFRDFCQDDYADYTSCVRTHPRVFENSFVYAVPFSEALSSCKVLRRKWLKCEDYREKELFEEMKKIYDLQRELA